MRDFISFLPFIVSVTGAVLTILKRNKSYPQLYFLVGIIALAIYFVADGFYLSVKPNYYAMLYADIASQFVTPMLPYIFLAYLRSLYRNTTFTNIFNLSLLPGLAMGFGAAIIYFVIGVDNSAGYLEAFDMGDTSAYTHPIYIFIKLWTNRIYSVVVAIGMVILLVGSLTMLFKDGYKIGMFYKFLLKGGKYRTSYHQTWAMFIFIVVSAIRLYYGRVYMIDHPLMAVTLSTMTAMVVTVLILCALSYRVEDGVAKDFFRNHRNDPDFGNPERLVNRYRTTEELKNLPIGQLILENDAQHIYSLIVLDKYYTEEDANLADAANKLKTSETNIATTIATLCNCEFNDILQYCRRNRI